MDLKPGNVSTNEANMQGKRAAEDNQHKPNAKMKCV